MQLLKIAANSKVSYNVGLSVGKGNISADVTYGREIAPNSEINKNYIMLEGGYAGSIGPAIYPHASYKIELGIKTPLDLFTDNNTQFCGPESGWKFKGNGGLGYHMATDGTTNFYPGISVGGYISYTWVWDNS